MRNADVVHYLAAERKKLAAVRDGIKALLNRADCPHNVSAALKPVMQILNTAHLHLHCITVFLKGKPQWENTI